MRLPAYMLLVTLPIACGRSVKDVEQEQAPPRPTVNHALHLARDLECIDCHDPNETCMTSA